MTTMANDDKSAVADQLNSADDSVIIIGAGAAGLTAAYDLTRKNIPVQVLEAHASQMGGRVRKLEGWADFPIDVGAEWIHEHPRILSKIVDDPSFCRVDCFETRAYKFAPFYEFRNKRWSLKYSQADEDEILYKFVNYTWYDFFRDHIAKSFLDTIQYECVVQSIDYSDSQNTVTVKCRNGRVFCGSQVIVTVSLPILQEGDITFTPALPKAKKHSIASVPFGLGLKAFLEFSQKFFYNNFAIYKKYKNCHGEMVFYNETAFQENPNKRSILAVYIYGDLSRKYIHTNNDEEIIRIILEELDEAYEGIATRTYIKGFVQNWTGNEPYIRGAYSSYRKGLKHMWNILQPLNNKVFFAGEHLPADGSEYGFVTGAALSGRSAAKAIQCVRKGEKPPGSWRVWLVHVLGTLCCGLEQWLFFGDID